MWTMDELVEQVRRALAAEYPGAPNGRVRDVPDRRAIRWYTTTGLVDRPSGMRGRTALYGPRHLLQLVAVKRRQAQGHSLAAIQAELAGATDAELATLARLPVVPSAPLPPPEPARPRFWAAPPAPAAPPTAPAFPASAAPPAPAAPPAFATPPIPAAPPAFAAPPAPPAPPFPAPVPVREVGGVALGGGAILILPARPHSADHAAIAAAAAPLLDLLATRGLLDAGPHTSAGLHKATCPRTPDEQHTDDGSPS
ncbi:MerR-like DNA binding protein [Couchioplanes caeruleus]|uniref:MerR-like DNA binding protein n=1 Tax=Couchioplanes caeruleus TaxID=56438 RepID=A0A3N1GVV9_9ACTN|nr:MerR-like DNA binding protein [Couchioplanes caeruleus]